MAISVATQVAGGIPNGIGGSYSHMLGLTWSRLEKCVPVIACSFI